MRILARREHSAAELSRKLVQRGFDPASVHEVLERLIDSDLLSESRYAQTLARLRARKGYGPLRIRAELLEAQVPDPQVRKALLELDWDFVKSAGQARSSRFRNAPTDAREWQQQYQFLARRGFEPEQIRAALQDSPED